MHGFDRIFLIGVMGAGKTSVGKELSKLLDFSFIDADVLLEQKLQLSIAEIIQLNGEISFPGVLILLPKFCGADQFLPLLLQT